MSAYRDGRGNYYVTAIRERVGEDGVVRRFGDEVGRQIKSRKAAFAILDNLNERGYVQCWAESRQQRFVVADRDAAGVWTAVNPYTGERVVLEAGK